MQRFIALCLILVCLFNIGATFQDREREKPRCIVIPAGQALIAVAAQSSSPLAFEDVKAFSCTGLHGMTGYYPFNSYRVRNRGTKPIRKFTVAAWSSAGTGYKSSWEGSTPEELIMPEQLAPVKEQEVEIVPLTKELRKKIKLDGAMKAVLILMVVNVEYADGTSYSDAATSKSLEEYFELVGGSVP